MSSLFQLRFHLSPILSLSCVLSSPPCVYASCLLSHVSSKVQFRQVFCCLCLVSRTPAIKLCEFWIYLWVCNLGPLTASHTHTRTHIHTTVVYYYNLNVLMSPVREAINLIIFRMGGFLVTVLGNIWFPKHCNLNASCHRAVSLIKSVSYRLARSFMEQKQHKLCWWKDRSKSLTAPNSRPSLFIARYRFAQIPLMTTSPTEVAWSWSFTEDELAETESKLLFNDGMFNQSVRVTADFKKKMNFFIKSQQV